MIRGYAGIGLDNPKFGVNVGSALRGAACYGAAFIAYTGKRADYRALSTDTANWRKHIPLFHVPDLKTVIPYDCVPVAVEIADGAKALHKFQHPQRCFYVFGQEDGTLGKRVKEWCADTIYIPTRFCMNLAACVNVVLYDRAVKTDRWAEMTRQLWTGGRDD